MTGISVTFAETTVPALSAAEQHRVEAALSRIAIGAPPGRWQERPNGIVVTDVLTDGRSGARVLRLEVQRYTDGRRKQAAVIEHVLAQPDRLVEQRLRHPPGLPAKLRHGDRLPQRAAQRGQARWAAMTGAAARPNQ